MDQLFHHELHVRVNVFEKHLVSRAKVIQARLTIGSLDKPMLRALSVAGEPHLACPAIFWQGFELRRAELTLLS